MIVDGTALGTLPCELPAGHLEAHRYTVKWAEPTPADVARLVEANEAANGLVPSCPECAAGKCPECDGVTWDNLTDAGVRCPCYQLAPAGHPRAVALSIDDSYDDGERVTVAEGLDDAGV